MGVSCSSFQKLHPSHHCQHFLCFFFIPLIRTSSGEMKKGSTALNGTARPTLISACYANSGQMNTKGSNVNHVSHRAQNGDCSGRQRPGQVRRRSQEPRVRPSSICTSPVTPTSHQRRWSADFSMYEATSVIIVTKNKKEPRPPQRGVSLLRPRAAAAAADSSFKRYSCPPIGIFGSLSPSSSSSSSSFSSSSSSCSSPPPVKTSVITGHDPLGWKLQPKSSSKSPRDRTKRLSLQIPLPVVFPDPESSPAPTPNPPPASKPKPPLKPQRRRHSDSSALVKSLPASLPVVTLEDLRAVHLRKVSSNSYDCDDVFSEEDEEGVEATASGCRTPPPVPEKSAMARQIAQLIALSWKRCASVITKTKEDHIYTPVKPKPKNPHQATKPGRSPNNFLSSNNMMDYHFKIFRPITANL